MKLLLKIKVIMLLILLIATGCSSHTQVVVKSRECAIPKSVELKSLDNRHHIGSEKNVAIMILNIADMVAYIKSLESALKCFEKR